MSLGNRASGTRTQFHGRFDGIEGLSGQLMQTSVANPWMGTRGRPLINNFVWLIGFRSNIDWYLNCWSRTAFSMRLSLALRFWNQILIWFSLNCNESANWKRLFRLMYSFCRYSTSNLIVCSLVNVVRWRRLFLVWCRAIATMLGSRRLTTCRCKWLGWLNDFSLDCGRGCTCWCRCCCSCWRCCASGLGGLVVTDMDAASVEFMMVGFGGEGGMGGVGCIKKHGEGITK